MRSQTCSGRRLRMAWLTLLFVALFGATMAEALAALPRFDLNGDGKSDLLWYDASTGSTAVWLMNGPTDLARSWLLTDPNWKVIATADFDGDGKADLLWYNAASGDTAMWLMNGTSLKGGGLLLRDANWKVIATPDLNGDGKADLLWYNAGEIGRASCRERV